MSRLLDLRLGLFLFPQFGEKLRQAFRGGIGKAVFGAEIQVIPQPFLIEIALNGRNGLLFHECNKGVNVSGGIVSIGHLPRCVYYFRLWC